MPLSSVICLLILVKVCKLTHSLTDIHTLPLSVESLFMPAIASSFHRGLMLHVQSVQDSLLINMITLPKIWPLCASSRKGWCEDNAHPDPFHTNTHVSRIFLDFSLCWFFFPFGSKWILIQVVYVLCSHMVSKVHPCNYLNESRREPASRSGVHC